MTRLFICMFVILFVGSTAMDARTNGMLGVYVDVDAMDCDIADDFQGVRTLWVVHTNATGATNVRFSAPLPACMNGTVWLADTASFDQCGMFGNTQTGVTCSYGSCTTGRVVAVGITIFLSGTSDPCCVYPTLPDPGAGSGEIETLDCSGETQFVQSQNAIVNGDASCRCQSAVPIDETTWGRIKMTYVD